MKHQWLFRNILALFITGNMNIQTFYGIFRKPKCTHYRSPDIIHTVIEFEFYLGLLELVKPFQHNQLHNPSLSCFLRCYVYHCFRLHHADSPLPKTVCFTLGLWFWRHQFFIHSFNVSLSVVFWLFTNILSFLKEKVGFWDDHVFCMCPLLTFQQFSHLIRMWYFWSNPNLIRF